jgi:hypothetical protein
VARAVRRTGAVLLLATMLLAQTPGEAAAERRRQGQIARGNTHREGVFGPTLAVRWGAPLGWSGRASVLFGDRHMMEDLPAARGILVGLEVGEGGARLSVGPTVWYHLLGWFPYGSLFAQTVKASLVRTWGDPREVDPDATYLGGGIEQGLYFLDFELGYLVKVGAAGKSPDGVVTWALGAGF